jgi:hypothetical protein
MVTITRRRSIRKQIIAAILVLLIAASIAAIVTRAARAAEGVPLNPRRLGEPSARPEPSAAPKRNPACIEVRGEARYRAMGYDHWVFVKNDCDARAACDVATDVSPKPTSIVVEPGATEEVLTFRGSPARTFTPIVNCRLQASGQ